MGGLCKHSHLGSVRGSHALGGFSIPTSGLVKLGRFRAISDGHGNIRGSMIRDIRERSTNTSRVGGMGDNNVSNGQRDI